MRNTMTSYDFVNWFANSESRKDQFSRAALFAMFDYYEEYEEGTGEEIEFDPIALCCEWAEYEDAVQACEEYDCDIYANEKDEEEANVLNWLRDQTQVIEFDGGILVAQF